MGTITAESDNDWSTDAENDSYIHQIYNFITAHKSVISCVSCIIFLLGAVLLSSGFRADLIDCYDSTILLFDSLSGICNIISKKLAFELDIAFNIVSPVIATIGFAALLLITILCVKLSIKFAKELPPLLYVFNSGILLITNIIHQFSSDINIIGAIIALDLMVLLVKYFSRRKITADL